MFGCSNGGCCCGFICGFVLVLLICAAAAFGVYCYFNPEVRTNGIARVEEVWKKVKGGGDNLLVSAREGSEAVPEPEFSIPEPRIEVNVVGPRR